MFQRIVEERIREALERGEFQDLPGQGEPLELEDDRGVPEDLRLAYKILKNADCLPPELMDLQEIQTTRDLLAGQRDEQERLRTIQKLNYLTLKLNLKRRRPAHLEEAEAYYGRVADRLEGSKP